MLKPPITCPVRGVIAHVSDPKRSTACTTALKNTPETLGLAPLLHKTINNRTHIFLTLCRFPTNSGQALSNDVMIRPRYFNVVTEFSDIPWAWKSLAVLALISSAISRHHLGSSPLAHWAVVVCCTLRDNHGTRISQQGHRG